MRILPVLAFILLVSCAHERRPASVGGNPVAYDSMALGNIQAEVVKVADKKDTCFDITLNMKGVDQREAQSSNWTVAWVDKESRFHLLNLNQRDPASVPKGGTKVAPYGAYEEWTNSFRTCAPNVNKEEIRSLILTPKELSYKETEGMTLEWK